MRRTKNANLDYPMTGDGIRCMPMYEMHGHIYEMHGYAYMWDCEVQGLVVNLEAPPSSLGTRNDKMSV